MNWHKHSNGGGAVADTASVDETAYVGESACVIGNAIVTGSSRILGTAIISGNTALANCTIKDTRIVGEAALCNVHIEGHGTVSGSISISRKSE